MTGEGFRMTSRASVILEPFGPERTSRAGSAKGKNLGSCRALAHKAQTDPLPPVLLLCKEGRGEVEYQLLYPTQPPLTKGRRERLSPGNGRRKPPVRTPRPFVNNPG